MAKTFKEMVAEAIKAGVEELFPWDLEEMLEQQPETLLLDVREPDEYAGAHIEGSLHTPRGILEQSCEWDYAETISELVTARERPVVVICRSGNRSVLATQVMQELGYTRVKSLKTGIKGWNDSDLPLVNEKGDPVDPDWADAYFNPPVSAEQRAPE